MTDTPDVARQFDVLQAFRLIDSLLTAGPSLESLLALRDRLAGELLSDADRVASTLADNFELRTVTGGSSTTTDRDALIKSIRRQSEAGGEAMMWMELEDLVVGESALAGQGLLRMLRAAPGATTDGQSDNETVCAHLTSIPLAFFLRFERALMTSEVIFMEGPLPESSVLHTGALPSIAQLGVLLNQA